MSVRVSRSLAVAAAGEMVSRLDSQLMVRVHTADKKGAGTDAKVFLMLCDSTGAETQTYELDNLHVNDHERGSVSEFRLPSGLAAGLADLDSIVLGRNDAGENASWFVDLVEVRALPAGPEWQFPVHRWVKPYTAYRVRQYDVSLPQNDDPDMRARRDRELAEKRQMYYCFQNKLVTQFYRSL